MAIKKKQNLDDKESVLTHSVRVICATLYYLVFRWLPRSTVPGGIIWRFFRGVVCRPLFLSCGTGVNIEHGAFFGSGHTISIGSNSGIGINARIEQRTTIGADVMMGEEVMIFTRNHQTASAHIPMAAQGFEDYQPVSIGDDVWIGARAIILSGVRVGRGSVIGAGAIVSKDVPEGAVVVGNPARVIRNRYTRSET